MVPNQGVKLPPKGHKMNLKGREIVNGAGKKIKQCSATQSLSLILVFFFL